MKRTTLLRRQALTRRVQLAVKPMPRRTRERARRVRRRATGADDATRATVIARAGGCCEVCTDRVAVYSVHHRRPRGMGGTRRADSNSAANLLLVCGSGTTGCHGKIERDRTWAYAEGYLVHQADDPAEVAVWIGGTGWTYLTATGTYDHGRAARD